MKNHLIKMFALVLVITKTLIPATVNHEIKPVDKDDHTQAIEFHIDLAADEILYKDTIMLSVNHPAVTITEWSTDTKAIKEYSPQFRTTKNIFNAPFTITVVTKAKSYKDYTTAVVHYSYLTNKARSPQEYRASLSADTTNNEPFDEVIEDAAQECLVEKEKPTETKLPTATARSISQALERLISRSDHVWLQILLILLLGLLMSLTPCIYPMVPITIGIMQGHGNTSLLRNFLLALSYSIGIATTFACLGLIAALSGGIFGEFACSPFVVLTIVALLIYLGLSMFGFYEMHIPSFLTAKTKSVKTGSFLSAFVFGIVSGSVASPCLSPGLAFVLCIVANIGSALLGFLLLFAFGIGLSIPLIAIGTFSNLTKKLPKSGVWMLEIKKLFGFLLFGMCFFYLKNILPWHMTLFGISLGLFATGLYYFYNIKTSDSNRLKKIKNILGTVAIAATVFVCAQAFHALYRQDSNDSFWLTSYDEAMTQARATKKLIFIDFWSTSCSVCAAIDKTLLADNNVQKVLQSTIPLKLEIGNSAPNKELQKHFRIKGLPTFLLIGTDETVYKKWGSELYRSAPQNFIDEISLLAKNHAPL